MTDQDFLTYREAAERFGTSRSKVTRAVKSGVLKPEKRKRNGREILTVSLEQLKAWASEEGLESNEVTTAVDHEQPVTDPKQPRVITVNRELSQNSAELQERMLDRMEQVQRRAIVLELQLQQTQRLLCENNESQHEREARTLEAEAKAEEAREREKEAREEAEMALQEAAQAKIELESLKTQMAAKEAEWSEKRKPWYKKIFRSS